MGMLVFQITEVHLLMLTKIMDRCDWLCRGIPEYWGLLLAPYNQVNAVYQKQKRKKKKKNLTFNKYYSKHPLQVFISKQLF